MSGNRLLIANGRLLNDRKIGKLTFCSHRGQSTLDYLLLNYEDFDTLTHFEILDFNEYSDHAPLTFNIRLKSKLYRANVNEENADADISRKIMWDKEKIYKII